MGGEDNQFEILNIQSNLKKYRLKNLFRSLGIRHIGMENAKLIAKNLKSFFNFISISKK